MNRRKKLVMCLSLVVAGLVFFSSGLVFAGGNPGQGKSNLEKARESLEEKLLGVAGFAGIAHSEDEGVIIVFVENEQAKGKVPDRHEGFPVRTEVTGKFKAIGTQVMQTIVPNQVNQVSTERVGEVRPVVGGISLSAYIEKKGRGRWAETTVVKYAGTLGMITYETENTAKKILSNAHVIAMDPEEAEFLEIGTATVQPGTYDDGTLANRVGALEKYIPIIFSKSPVKATYNYADAAIATLEAEGLSGWQYGEEGNYQLSGTATVVAEDSVRKSGRTTGVTTSTVYNTNATVWVWYTEKKRALFGDQILVNQPFIEAGDSGSSVDKGGKFVGLAFAASNSSAVVCKASYIIDGLGVSVE